MTTPALPALPEATTVELHRLAVAAAREAGRLIVDKRPPDLGVSQTKSSITDVVTVMDQRAQDLLRRRLLGARPGDGFFGEEEGADAGSSAVTWVVDPIDGTVNYLYRIPAYAVSVAAVVGDPRVPGSWQTVAGAVHDPVADECFSARLGAGAWRSTGGRDPVALHVGDTGELGMALVGTGFGYRAEMRDWQARVLVELIRDIRDVRRIGSAALDLCHIADRRLDAYFERGLNPWDLAAGWLVVSEAGGALSGLDGPPDSAMVVAGNRALHGALVDRLRAAVAAVG